MRLLFYAIGSPGPCDPIRQNTGQIAMGLAQPLPGMQVVTVVSVYVPPASSSSSRAKNKMGLKVSLILSFGS